MTELDNILAKPKSAQGDQSIFKFPSYSCWYFPISIVCVLVVLHCMVLLDKLSQNPCSQLLTTRLWLDRTQGHNRIHFNLLLRHVTNFILQEPTTLLCYYRLKQSVQPSEGVDYSFLSPLYETLEELYITGTPALSPVLMHFSRLHTLSLGINYMI